MAARALATSVRPSEGAEELPEVMVAQRKSRKLAHSAPTSDPSLARRGSPLDPESESGRSIGEAFVKHETGSTTF
jgi:hypothetical protein